MPAYASRLDRDLIRQLFDLRSASNALTGGWYEEDPYPIWHELREQAPVHEGTFHDLTRLEQPAFFFGLPQPDVAHFSLFSYAAVDEAFRNQGLFTSRDPALPPVDHEGPLSLESTMFTMSGKEHRRNRSLVQPSFAPAKMRWWIENWTEAIVQDLIDNFIADGRADLNVDFCAAIPLLTITGSFGISEDEALALRQALRPGDPANTTAEFVKILAPVLDARRAEPADDLISVLVRASITDEDGVTHTLTDAEIFAFSYLILLAGSGTTWKQMGITLAALLSRPELLRAIRDDRTLLRGAIEEAVRWVPTDPMFSRWATEDVDFHGCHIPAGSVVHLGVGPANRDPARWERPDEYDPSRQMLPNVGFGSGPHTCLGMHVARSEITTGINALLDRLPNLRLDPDATPPRYIGFYERGATEIPVVFDV